MLAFNNKIRQLLFLALILLLAVVLITQLTAFLPGLLGGIMLYIISREWYYRLVFEKKWKKGWTALLFMLIYIFLIALPIFLSVKMITPRVNSLIKNQHEIVESVKIFSAKLSSSTGIEMFSDEKIQSTVAKVTSYIPSVLNSAANVLTNLIMMFFLFYYLLVSGKEIEKFMSGFIPLKQQSISELAKETKTLVKANALGIPLISLIQGATAALGYCIFGVKDWGMWGFVTGVFAFFPVIGTMIIWIPLVVYLYSIDQTWSATGLMIYSIIVTGNVDYITRLGLLKRMGNVHPMITVLGVIAGLNLFGFIGLIFGPLLVSYFVIFTKIYVKEFGTMPNQTMKKHDPSGVPVTKEEPEE